MMNRRDHHTATDRCPPTATSARPAGAPPPDEFSVVREAAAKSRGAATAAPGAIRCARTGRRPPLQHRRCPAPGGAGEPATISPRSSEIGTLGFTFPVRARGGRRVIRWSPARPPGGRGAGDASALSGEHGPDIRGDRIQQRSREAGPARGPQPPLRFGARRDRMLRSRARSLRAPTFSSLSTVRESAHVSCAGGRPPLPAHTHGRRTVIFTFVSWTGGARFVLQRERGIL